VYKAKIAEEHRDKRSQCNWA